MSLSKEKKTVGEHIISSGEDRRQVIVVHEDRTSETRHERKNFKGDWVYKPLKSKRDLRGTKFAR